MADLSIGLGIPLRVLPAEYMDYVMGWSCRDDARVSHGRPAVSDV